MRSLEYGNFFSFYFCLTSPIPPSFLFAIALGKEQQSHEGGEAQEDNKLGNLMEAATIERPQVGVDEENSLKWDFQQEVSKTVPD